MQIHLTSAERTLALDLLTSSTDTLRSATASVTDAQWRFAPGPSRWAMADIVEHLAKSDAAVYQLIVRQLLPQTIVAAAERSTLRDQAVIMAVENRLRRFQAAELVRPTREWTTPAGLLQQFEANRAVTIEFLRQTPADLRGRLADHPVLGRIDAYQWLLFLGAHTNRHLAQLAEVKADPAFPQG